MGAFQDYARAAMAAGGRRGRAPVMNAQRFYPRGIERELQQKTEAEFMRIYSRFLEAALEGFSTFKDEQLDLFDTRPELSEKFKGELMEIARKTEGKARENFSRQSEMIIGAPYYPPGAAEGVLNDWHATFQDLCVSACAQQKTKIATIVAGAKQAGWNRDRLERAIKEQLPGQFKHRAALIARTELAKLNTRVTLETYKSTGVQYYKWLTTIDGRERASHASMNGKICSVSDGGVYFEQNPEHPLRPVEHPRSGEMYHGHPGTDFQCRCSMVMWDPEIDGDYEVKDSDLLERREAEENARKEAQERAEAERQEEARAEREKAAEALRNAKEAAAKAEAERIAAERAKAEAEREAARLAGEARAARLEAAAIKRHAGRTPEREREIVAAWNARRIRRTAEARHAARTKQKATAIRTKLQKRLGIREDARKILAESEGMAGIGREGLEAAAKGGNAKSYKAMEREAAAIGKRLDELKAMQHVGDPMAAAKKYGYPDTVAAEKAVESTLKNCGFASLSNPDKKTALENEIAIVKKRKGNAARLEFMAYDRLLAGVETEIKWEGLKTGFDAIKAAVKAHPKSAKLAAAYGKLETAFNARNEADFNAALAEAKKAVPKPKEKAAAKAKKISPSWSKSYPEITNADGPKNMMLIEQVLQDRGFNASPTLVGNDDFMRLLAEDHQLLTRTYGTDKTSEVTKLTIDARESLYRGDFFVRCKGGHVHGYGMYFGADTTKGLNAWTNADIIDQYAQPFHFEEFATLKKDARIVQEKDVYGEYLEAGAKKAPTKRLAEFLRAQGGKNSSGMFVASSRATSLSGDSMKAAGLWPLTDAEFSFIEDGFTLRRRADGRRCTKKEIDADASLLSIDKDSTDTGVMAAKLGYDAIYDNKTNYTVVLNRGKMILLDRDKDKRTTDEIFKENFKV